ncbi:hypothetical protein [Sulfobacillus thermosulfidooxidans]|uniref:Uncharacterized protein n=2 Tax=Sulfobacillus thermosulfidooxidans TaxID=28034 RepID=A0A1W1W7B6_SULTA|nr:hypothetical protein [Sulfobacillus thermosulfidooxidans]OLZ08120.1 hypothetical protein BFX05_04915 [Sulfobacillus thermosulfidooxidans]OLZ16534.1 hypothetical protein BFX06_15300 [Sulfobacillus thermosulfidooxidans]OLZ19621.1 hypothetical protein BFX07_02875 [Sulfobacillus thermosulfidooxidans]PSR23569.1 MAG: hypothetical protein C7B47_15715 [Sulfobacillus thermosulfidooxidans]SMC02168.1 hypothetical protein SAMN00768000_0386 [Sulfobacillus thermosulfidooxidans DSM 9293]
MLATGFVQSPFVPIAIGFFGLGTCYFVWGGQALFGTPKTSPEVSRALSIWGIWMGGFMQFITGVYLMVGLSWFGVYTHQAPLYMAAVAFTSYGVHWFAIGWRRYIGANDEVDGYMALAFLAISILGVLVFHQAGDVPVTILFALLALIYLLEIPTRLASWTAGVRAIGFVQFITAIWLMYLTYGVVMDVALTQHWWI